MAEKNPPVDSERAGPDSGPSGGPAPRSRAKALVGRFLVLAFVLGVVLAECAMAYFFLPSTSQVAPGSPEIAAEEPNAEPSAKPHSKAGKDKKEGKNGRREKEGKEGKEAKETADEIEVDLGEYSVTAAHPSANATLQITFHLYGTVATAEEEEFRGLKQENEHRFREQVLVTVRSAKISDLTDAGLGLLKRSILEKTNRALGRPILRAVIFSDFVFVEQ